MSRDSERLLSGVQDYIDDLEKQIRDLESEKDDLRERLNDLSKDRDAVAGERDALADDFATAMTKFQELEAVNFALQKQIEESKK